jgi:hypothetical protein
MNPWTDLSIKYANQRNYLDDLFVVYPCIPEGIRGLDEDLWGQIEKAFGDKDNNILLKSLLNMDLFPIKDSYVAYLKRDSSAIDRNPATVSRLCGRLYELGLDGIYDRCTEPKETNRQIGPLFRRWLHKGTLGVPLMRLSQFIKTDENAILDVGDAELMNYAYENLGYKRNKGLDFIARFNKKYVIGEAKFLTDFGGHQNAQFEDAISTLNASTNSNTIKIAILDGVLYIKGGNKMYNFVSSNAENYNIMSSLVLREFLYQV